MAKAKNLMGAGISAGTATQMASEMSALATLGFPGAVAMQPAIPNVAGTSPTKAEYNALLAALRLAGVISPT